VAEFGALSANSPERCALLRKNRLCHSPIGDWRRQLDSGSPASGGKKEKPAKAAEPAEPARLPHGLLSRRRTESRAARRHPPVPRDRPHPGQAEKNRRAGAGGAFGPAPDPPGEPGNPPAHPHADDHGTGPGLQPGRTIAFAARIPAARFGATVEVRPMLER
jgi:hypothetical protein